MTACLVVREVRSRYRPGVAKRSRRAHAEAVWTARRIAERTGGDTRVVIDSFLIGKPMPKWYEEGVQRLDMEDHLKARQQTTKPPATQTGQSAESKEKEKQN